VSVLLKTSSRKICGGPLPLFPANIKVRLSLSHLNIPIGWLLVADESEATGAGVAPDIDSTV
jgi:hypothetical protein